VSGCYPESRRPGAGRGHVLTGPAEGAWGCSACDWSTGAGWAITRSSAAREFARDDRHAAARPVLDALDAQQLEHRAQLELVPQASRDGAQRVAVDTLRRKWREADDERRQLVREAWPALAIALDVLIGAQL
jgi:hypothetical protein